MRRAALFLVLALLTAPAYAGSDEFDIRLGKAPPPPPPVDRAKVSAVELFLSGRQAGSREPARRAAARALLACKADDATLFGPKFATLAAYDFHDAAIEPDGRGAFNVTAYLLFANKDGVVLESRDETLRFAARGKGYVCTSIQLTNAMTWDRDGVARAADAIGAAEALVRADAVLHAWTTRQHGTAAYSVADIRKSEDGRVLVQCLRFTALRGRRGFDAMDSTLVLHKDGSGYSVDAH